jgi:hypothetical protein
MGRTLFALGLILLAGCVEVFSEVHLTVTNVGVEPVNVNASALKMNVTTSEHSEHKFQVAPGESRTVRFTDVLSLDVTIRRTGDQTLLFDENWSNTELKSLHRKVTVTVSP